MSPFDWSGCTGILLGSVGYCVVLYLAPKRRVSGEGKAVFITGLYALVNNAGVWQPGEIEWVSMAAYRRVMEVNAFGTVQVTKAFLPLIRRAKGRVVNVSSAAGLHAGPFAGAYSMTKASVEFFSDALRHEMHKWGVKVVIVEPASFGRATNIVSPVVFDNFVDDLRNNVEDVVKEDYGMEYFDVEVKQLRIDHQGEGASRDPTAVIETMVDSVTLATPSHRYLVGSSFEDYVTWMWLGYFPTRWTGSTLLAEKEGDSKPAMLKKTH